MDIMAHQEKTELKFHEAPLRRTRADIDITHESCTMTELAKRLESSFSLYMPNDAVRDDIIFGTFAIPKKYSQSEVSKLFEGLANSIVHAEIYFGDLGGVGFTGFELEYRDNPIAHIMQHPGFRIQEYWVTPEKENLIVDMWGLNPLRRFLSSIGDKVNADIKSSIRVSPLEEPTPRSLLTGEETDILQHLLDRGLYEIPKRGITLQQVAPELGRSDSKLSQDLRRITGKLFADYLKKTSASLR